MITPRNWIKWLNLKRDIARVGKFENPFPDDTDGWFQWQDGRGLILFSLFDELREIEGD